MSASPPSPPAAPPGSPVTGDRAVAGPGPRRGRGWRFGVPVLLVAAGLLLATTSRDPHAGVTRTSDNPLVTQVLAEQAAVAKAGARQAALTKQVDALTDARAVTDSRVAAQQAIGAALGRAVGLTPATGSSYTVSLDDAPRGAPVAAGYPAPTSDDLVVHQQDVQAVVNALWAGGASAMTIMGQRVISTSAVTCVGNTLLLQGRVYSPPFVVTALGNRAALAAAVDAAPGVRVFRQYVAAYGLVLDTSAAARTTVPGYDGSVQLSHAQPIVTP